MIVVVVKPTFEFSIILFTPVKFTLPTALVPIPLKVELNPISNILISWSLSNFSVGSNTRFLTPVDVISVFISPNLSFVKSVVFSSIMISFWSVKVTTSVNWTSDESGSIIWIKKLLKSSLNSLKTVSFAENPTLENSSLILSCIKTLFVLHLVKSVRVLFTNCKFLDLLSNTLKSVTKSKLLIASTLIISSITSKVTDVTESSPLLIGDTSIFFSTDVSAKFFNPAGWTRRFTGFTSFSHSIGLFIVYDRFW